MIALVSSALVTVAVCAPVRRFVVRWGVIDIPNQRSSHSRPTPRGGGLACATGILVACALAAPRGDAVLWAVVGAACALAALGYLDDRRGVDPLLRLVAQTMVGAALGSALSGVMGLFLGLLVLPLILNAVNFMDGVNGITGITVCIWGLSAMWVGGSVDSATLLILGSVTAGSALGFLPWNLPTARLFLGDVGSYLFGGLIAGGVMVGALAGTKPAILVAPLVLYLFDVGATLLRRFHRGAPLLQAHRDHVYQRLTHSLGLPHGLVAVLAGVGAAAITLAWLLPEWWASVACTVLVLSAYLASPKLSEWWRRRTPNVEVRRA